MRSGSTRNANDKLGWNREITVSPRLRNHPLVAGRYFYTLPLRLMDAIQGTLQHGHLGPGRLRVREGAVWRRG
jgi:hypothetical protein